MKQNKANLEEALFTLIDTLNDPEAKERDFQKVFEEHPDILYSLGYSDFLKEPKLHDPATDADYYPDFVALRTHDRRAEVIDLKRPDLSLRVLDKRGRRRRLSAEVSSYVSQVAEYARFFGDRANRQWFSREHGWDIAANPRTKIIGGGFDVERDEVNRLLDQNGGVTLSTYVDVLSALMAEHSRRYNSGGESFARQFVANLRIHDQDVSGDDPERFYIFDQGHKFNRNRCSLWVDRAGLVGFTAFDDKRRKVEVRSRQPICKEQSGLLTVELQASEDVCIAAILVNGRTIDYHASSTPFEMDQKLLDRKKYIGGNLKTESGAYFDLEEYLEYDRILSVEERSAVYATGWAKLMNPDTDAGVRFFPESVMRIVPGGGKVVPGKKKPIYLGEGNENPLSDFFRR